MQSTLLFIIVVVIPSSDHVLNKSRSNKVHFILNKFHFRVNMYYKYTYTINPRIVAGGGVILLIFHYIST